MHIAGYLKTLAELLLGHWLDVVIVVAGLTAAVLLWRRGRVDIVKHLIRTLVVEAEKEYGSGTGRIKFEAVLTAVYERIPALLRLLISKKRIEEWIEEAVQWLKASLEVKNANLLGQGEETMVDGNVETAVGNS